MFNSSIESQFFIQTPKRVGVASELADIVANQASANIRSLSADEFGKEGRFYLITDNNPQVQQHLKDSGYKNVHEQQVLVVQTPDERGTAAEVTRKLADAKINIEFLWTTIFDNQPAIVLHTSDNQRAWKLFN